MTPLKPCPFCSSTFVEVKHQTTTLGTYWAVFCDGCACRGPVGYDGEMVAAMRWNDRGDCPTGLVVNNGPEGVTVRDEVKR